MVLDAMAQGKAIISTTIGCEGLEVDPGDNVEIADDPIHFAKKSIAMLKNSEHRRFLGKNARRLVEAKYSWGSIAKRLHETYLLVGSSIQK